MRSMKQFAIFCTMTLISITACKKTEGPKGDTGPAGPAGSNGAGIQVMTFTTTFSSWTAYNTPYNYDEATLNVSSVTSSVVASGDVSVYFKRVTALDTSWVAL